MSVQVFLCPAETVPDPVDPSTLISQPIIRPIVESMGGRWKPCCNDDDANPRQVIVMVSDKPDADGDPIPGLHFACRNQGTFLGFDFNTAQAAAETLVGQLMASRMDNQTFSGE